MISTTKTATELKAERDKLNAAIRKAERAEKAAAQKALLDAKHSLGVWFAESMGLTTVEAIEAVREALNPDTLKGTVSAQPVTETATADDRHEDEPVVEDSGSHEHEIGQRQWSGS